MSLHLVGLKRYSQSARRILRLFPRKYERGIGRIPEHGRARQPGTNSISSSARPISAISHIAILCNVLSLRLDAGKFDYASPLLGFLGHELREVGDRSRKRLAAEIGHPCLHHGIG